MRRRLMKGKKCWSRDLFGELEIKIEKSYGRIPTALRKELDRLNPTVSSNSDEEIDSDVGNDFYEYEEEVPQEESRKNHGFDPVHNYEYELLEDFEDENVSSDDDDGDGDFDVGGNKGNQIEDVDGKKRKNNAVISEAHPESEYNPNRDVLEGDGQIAVQDLLDPIQGKRGYSKLRKRLQHMDRKSTSIQVPLPTADREKLREDGCAIASEFEPRTNFEKKTASLVYDDEVMEAHKGDGCKLLEKNK
ncbi:hypothetical protein DITRI_Ditri14bG0134300 [Diplodiscus trichospermus]